MGIFDEPRPERKPELKPQLDTYTATTGINSKTFGAEYITPTKQGIDISFGSECTVTPVNSRVSFGAGVNVSQLNNGKTRITPGLETALSLQGDSTKTQVLPTLKVTQDVGKNTKLVASVKPYRIAPVQVGVRFNF